MLWHQSDTNLNEAMNRSVSAFAPKDRTFCRTMSLETRVGIAAAVQIVGHYQFWNMVLDKFGITMGKSLEKILKKRDVENYFRREYRSRPEVKRKRKHGETTKISKGVRDREKQISSDTYKSGVAICAEQHAKKIVNKLMEQSKQIQNCSAKQTCRYYPHFCKKKGHASAASKACAMYGKSKKEKDDALKEITKRLMAEQIQIAKHQGELCFLDFSLSEFYDTTIFMISMKLISFIVLSVLFITISQFLCYLRK